MLRFIFRHLSGSRATEVDVVPFGEHRELILGRAESAAVRFDPQRESMVGRHHARITRSEHDGASFELSDLGSRNGTWLNGQRIEHTVVLHDGDIVRLSAAGPEIEVRMETSA